MATEEESTEQAAASRREKLGALRAAQELLRTSDEVDPKSNADDDGDTYDDTRGSNNPSMRFRNYVPQDKELQGAKLAAPVLPKFENPFSAAAPPPPDNKEDTFLNIAPKKPNYDPQRDVQKKLDKLERHTQKAMFKLMC